MRLLVFDPSGNKSEREGDGCTGWALFEDGELKDFGRINSWDHDSIEDYWWEHRWLTLNTVKSMADRIVCESYKLFAHKAQAQAWSELETPQLIGFLRMTAWGIGVPFIFQDPAAKPRFADPILVHMGVVEKRGNKHYALGRPTVIHERDAIRHGYYYLKYGDKDAEQK